MSLPEIIPSNLPQFVQNKARSNFSNSVIPSGSVLLFAESDGNGGSKLIAKNPDGSFTEVGGGGSTTHYYCCIFVNTTNQTWSGYEYFPSTKTVSSTLTTGLAYTSVVPSVDHFYTADALLEVLPNFGSGPMLYVPLHSYSSTAVTGQSLSGGYSTFETYQGIPALICDGTSYLTAYDSSDYYPYGNSARTIMLWVHSALETSDVFFVDYGGNGSNIRWSPVAYSTRFGITGKGGNTVAFSGQLNLNAWNHLVFMWDVENNAVYQNGVSLPWSSSGEQSVSHSWNTSQERSLRIGGSDIPEWGGVVGHIAEVKVYDRAISDTERLLDYYKMLANVVVS